MKTWNSNHKKNKFQSWEVPYLPEETAEYLVNAALLWGLGLALHLLPGVQVSLHFSGKQSLKGAHTEKYRHIPHDSLSCVYEYP